MKKIAVFCFLLLLLFSTESFAENNDRYYFTLKSMKQLKKEHVTIQTLDYSCGVASLTTLLNRYFDDNRFLETDLLKDIVFRLNDEEIVSRVKDGFSMLDLKKVSERIGYMADGVALPHSAVYKLKGPIIILLRKDGIKHFVVLRGAVSGMIYISDPVIGNYRLPEWSLAEQWKGEALVIGRSGFGLPSQHGLTIRPGEKSSTAGYTARGLMAPKNIGKTLR